MKDKIGISFSFGAASRRDSREFARYMESCSESLDEAAGCLEAGAAADKAGFGWYGLPELNPDGAFEAAEWLKSYDAIIHVGIGGSSLGNLMLHQALLPMYYNELPAKERGPRFYLADNPDPAKARSIMERVGGDRAALVGVSKSGATAETMSQFLWFMSQLGGNPSFKVSEDVLVVTDPESGVFRTFAEESKCRSLEIPASVGGRYSVLSPSGLVSLAALGGDVTGLLSGARAMKRALAEEKEAGRNPAKYYAALCCYHERAGRPMKVFMPYASRLEMFAEWFAQLWGESIGKNGRGTTPVRALGAIDQHSQVQLYTDGPDDKLFTIIDVKDRGGEIIIPKATGSLSSLSYMAGKGLGQMLGYEARSTASALVKAGRPLVWIELSRLDAPMLGALVFFWEYTTALTGRLMEINPFDQPGVEQGKRYTYGLMGRESFDKDAEEAKTFFKTVEEQTITI